MEAFYTVQGEGFHQGKPAYFIRLAGCDVGCHWCDVKESWPAEDHPNLTIRQIVDLSRESESEWVVITGGEPLMYNLDSLCEELSLAGKQVHVETSGAHPLSGKFDWICFSPKKFKAPKPEYYEFAHELKVVIFNQSDFAWAEEHAQQVNDDCLLYLQPEWSKEKAILPKIIGYVKQHPKWRISLQVHKYMDIP
ncbi:MAG: 7-carboxy-7-deazaguanine synthase QueE [Bacteroidota bacterium]